MNDTIPPILRMLNNAKNKTRSAKEDEAARQYVLGQITLAQYFLTKRQ